MQFGPQPSEVVIAMSLFRPVNLAALFSSILSQSVTLARPLAVLAAARGDLFPRMGTGWSSMSR